jgi:very-short-patch-repair endonuclease
VSSFLYSDINSTQVRPGTGLEFLKNYLEYAASGGRLLTSSKLTTEPSNEFELDIQEALSAEGIVLVPQLGCSSFRIDLAACHPTAPGRYVLAIECDGATYHSGYTARDRDRLRQQQLERLGWTFHRIWSTDWFLRRDEEIKRTVEAFHRAVQKSDLNSQPKRGPARPNPVTPPPAPTASDLSTYGARSSRTPPIKRRTTIDHYSTAELRTLLRWIESDGKLRTNDELAHEMFQALPFARRGSRIDAVIKEAIARG